MQHRGAQGQASTARSSSSAASSCSESILAILDATIVNVAIPTLGAEFRTSISTIQWVMTAYLLAFASVIPLTAGRATASARSASGSRRSRSSWLGPRWRRGAWSIDVADRLPRRPGRRRAGLIMPVGQTILAHAAGPRAHRARDERRRHPDAARADRRAGDRRRDRRRGELALDLLRQPARRRRRARRWPGGCSRTPRRGAISGSTCAGSLLLSPGIAIFVYGLSEIGSAGASRRTALALIGDRRRRLVARLRRGTRGARGAAR